MITLKKEQNLAHKITNDNGVVTIGTSSKRSTEGYTPVDYLASSVALCMGLTLDAVIARDQLDVAGYTIEVRLNKAEDRPSRFESLDVRLEFESELTDKEKKKLIMLAKRGCTIGNTIEQSAEIHVVAE